MGLTRLVALSDLRFHNLGVMDPKMLRMCGETLNHEIIMCQHMGRLHFWGFDRSGTKLQVAVRAFAANCARVLAVFCGFLLPRDHPRCAPFIVYVARKSAIR
jgi:hypothetical protein